MAVSDGKSNHRTRIDIPFDFLRHCTITFDQMKKWTFFNDDYIEAENALLHFKDLSFQRGYGLFDFFRLVGDQPLFLDDHLDRFYASAEAMHLKIDFSRAEIKTVIQNLILRNNLPGTGVRLNLTGGYSADGFTIASPNLTISQTTFSSPSKDHMENGISLLSYPHVRQLPHIKTTDYIMAVWLQPLLKQKGVDDVLFHQNGILSECSRNNFLLVTMDDRIITPHQNILPGITRKKLLEVAAKEFEVEERTVTLQDIREAKEAFITGTIKQILPVARVDDVVFNDHKISNQLRHCFQSAYINS